MRVSMRADLGGGGHEKYCVAATKQELEAAARERAPLATSNVAALVFFPETYLGYVSGRPYDLCVSGRPGTLGTGWFGLADASSELDLSLRSLAL